jgi:hypothetical protein
LKKLRSGKHSLPFVMGCTGPRSSRFGHVGGGCRERSARNPDMRPRGRRTSRDKWLRRKGAEEGGRLREQRSVAG